jgi:hypothetical protein
MNAKDCPQSQSLVADTGLWLKGECDRDVSSHCRAKANTGAKPLGRREKRQALIWRLDAIAQPAIPGTEPAAFPSGPLGLAFPESCLEVIHPGASLFLRCLALLRSGKHMPPVSYKSCAVSSGDAFPLAYILPHSSVTTSEALNLSRYCC